jgi:hypothetical protein
MWCVMMSHVLAVRERIASSATSLSPTFASSGPSTRQSLHAARTASAPGSTILSIHASSPAASSQKPSRFASFQSPKCVTPSGRIRRTIASTKATHSVDESGSSLPPYESVRVRETRGTQSGVYASVM